MTAEGGIRRAWIGLVVAAAALLAACGWPSEEKRQAGSGDVSPVRVLMGPYLGYAPFVIAQEEGYFADYGIEVEFVQFNQSSRALPSLLQGDLDVYSGSINAGTFNAMARDSTVRMVSDKGVSMNPENRYAATLVRRDLIESGQFRGPADLRGLVVNRSATATPEYLLDVLLEAGGLTDEDITVVNMPPASRLQALNTGSVDVVSTLAEPWLSRALDAGNAVIWKSMAELEPGCQYAAILFGHSLLHGRRDEGVRFLAAYLRALEQYQRGKTERNLSIMEEFTGLDRETLIRCDWPEFHPRGEPNLNSLDAYQKWALEKGYTDRFLEREAYFDGSLLEEANALLQAGED